MLLADVITAAIGAVTDILPDFDVLVAAGVIFGLAAYAGRRFLKMGR